MLDVPPPKKLTFPAAGAILHTMSTVAPMPPLGPIAPPSGKTNAWLPPAAAAFLVSLSAIRCANVAQPRAFCSPANATARATLLTLWLGPGQASATRLRAASKPCLLPSPGW